MGRAQDYIDHVGKLGQNRRERFEHVLDAFIGGEQPKGEQNSAALNLELVFEKSWVTKSDVGDAVRNQIDFAGWSSVYLLQHFAAAIGHYDQSCRERYEFFHRAALVSPRFKQHGVKCGDDGHLQFPEHGEDVSAGGTAEDAELMLQTHDVHITDV